jgi:hypothetical protein
MSKLNDALDGARLIDPNSPEFEMAIRGMTKPGADTSHLRTGKVWLWMLKGGKSIGVSYAGQDMNGKAMALPDFRPGAP